MNLSADDIGDILDAIDEETKQEFRWFRQGYNIKFLRNNLKTLSRFFMFHWV